MSGTPSPLMQLDIVSLFPPMFEALTNYGVTRRAFEQNICTLAHWNPRDFATDNYRTIDNRPFGGGPGMVMTPEPLDKAITSARERQAALGIKPKVIYLSPQGPVLKHERVMELSREPGLVLIAGRYEGIDERVLQQHDVEEISLGDYVLSGGELAVMVLLDAIIRQLPGVLNDAQSAVEDSFYDGLLDCPHYTRPEVYLSQAVPPVLLSGNHAEIAKWRLLQRLQRTQTRRPDLFGQRVLSKQESRLLGLEPPKRRRKVASEQEQGSNNMEKNHESD